MEECDLAPGCIMGDASEFQQGERTCEKSPRRSVAEQDRNSNCRTTDPS